MRIYDFSKYYRQRQERKAAEAVIGVVAEINRAGSVPELKVRVNQWFDLHREVLKQVNSS